jgi:prepilin-type N-terminal cleavage/methylation domain-containing protein/prepilin-type processing-associated H-X9-DG protein
MKSPLFLQRARARRRPAFTLIEMIVVLGIIALLVSLSVPNMTAYIQKAQAAVCAEHLHGIGVAVLSYATDNNSVLPEINQTAPPLPYPTSVGGIVQVLGNYGITTNTTQCPVDMASGAGSSFAQYGSSYEWNPVLDDGTDPVTSLPIGTTVISVSASRIRVCTDFLQIHNGKVNALYGDGHTRLR